MTQMITIWLVMYDLVIKRTLFFLVFDPITRLDQTRLSEIHMQYLKYLILIYVSIFLVPTLSIKGQIFRPGPSPANSWIDIYCKY